MQLFSSIDHFLKFLSPKWVQIGSSFALLFSPFSFATSSSFSDLYFLASDNQVKLLDQKLEYSVRDKNSIQIGNLVVSNENFKLYLDEKNNLIAEGPFQLMYGGTLILKDPLGKSLWDRTIDNFSDFLDYDSNKSITDRKKNETGKFLLDSASNIRDYIDINSIFTFCIFNETKTNRIQICTPIYTLESVENKWILKSPTNQIKKDNVVIVNGVEVNEHGIIQFDKEVQSVAIAINLASGLYSEIKAVPITLEFLDLDYDESKEEVELKLREKFSEKKTNLPWTTKVSIKNPFLYIESFGQIPLKQELKIDRDLLPKTKDRPILEKSISKTYASSVSLKFKKQANLKLRAATKGDSIRNEGDSVIWSLNNIKIDDLKPHLLKIQSNEMKFTGAFEVSRSPSWTMILEFGSGNQQTKTETQSSSLTENQINSLTQFNLNKYFDSFLGSDSSSMRLRWGVHLRGLQRSNSQTKLKSTDSEFDISYRFNENFHHSESSSSLRLSGLSRSLTPSNSEVTTAQWVGLQWTHDGPHNFQNIFLKSLLGSGHDIQLSYFGVCLNEECKKTVLMNFSWQTLYSFQESFFWSWKLAWENTLTKSEELTQSSNRYELLLGLGIQF